MNCGPLVYVESRCLYGFCDFQFHRHRIGNTVRQLNRKEGVRLKVRDEADIRGVRLLGEPFQVV